MIRGGYAIVIGSDWIPDHSRVEAGSEFWVVGTVVDGFAPNVDILNEPASGMTLDAYRASSIQGASQIVAQFDVLESGVTTGTFAQPIGFVRFSGSIGGPVLNFLSVFILDADRAILATFTAPPGSFDTLLPEVEPFLMTLRSP